MKAGRLVGCAALCAALALPSAAQAAVVQIDGDPLDVFLGDGGRLQARSPGAAGGQFFPPSSDEASAGFQLGVDLQHPDAAAVFGFNNKPFTPGGQNPVTGTGTTADPFRQVTSYSLTTPGTGQRLTVIQTAEYVNGRGGFGLRWDVTNGGATPTVVRPSLSADLFAGGADGGTGFIEAGPPRVVGGVSSANGGTAGIVEVSPWAAYQEDHYTTVFGRLADLTPGGGLQSTINPDSVDNGVAVQGPDVAICAGTCATATTTFEAAWRFVNFASFRPGDAGRLVGTEHSVRAKIINADGSPRPGISMPYTISGTNPAQGTATTDHAGRARISWTSTTPGRDTLSAYADLNGNGTREIDSEPAWNSTVDWLAPELARTVVVERARGTVLVKLPPGASPARYGLRAKDAQAGGFIPLTGTAAVPVRSLVDTSRGELKLTSAASSRGRRTQSANFRFGTFQVIQKRARRPVTEMVLKGGTFRGCPSTRARRSAGGDPVADESQRRRSRRSRVRRLWGNGRGRFRTRGRFSSATVRGTRWIVEDRCGGTLTRLPRRPSHSRVDVRDHVARRTIRLTAGRSYLAVPRSARRRSGR